MLDNRVRHEHKTDMATNKKIQIEFEMMLNDMSDKITSSLLMFRLQMYLAVTDTDMPPKEYLN